jgi:CxxC motif-containing protein (DUF1111 family)
MKAVKLVSVSKFVAPLLLCAGAAFAQTIAPNVAGGTPKDPGFQSANRNTGLPLSSVNANDGTLEFFDNGLVRFQDVEAVANAANVGLGPRFNFNQCAGCHVAPAIGGASGPVNFEASVVGDCNKGVSQNPLSIDQGPPLMPHPEMTPQQKGAIACSSTNTTPSFVTAGGPTVEVRFPFFFNANGTVNTNSPNGGVEDLFTVSGRPDGAANCNISQPNFAAAIDANNIIFRIPISAFGDGLVENLDDSTLVANQTANLNNNLGISGSFNHNGNDGTIARFGWKAQNKSLELFSGEAYNVEMGITNELFQNERPLPAEELSTGLPVGCLNLGGKGYPEDATNFSLGNDPNQFTGNATQSQYAMNATIPSDIMQFAMFMRLLAPPQPGGVVINNTAVSAATISAGQSLFNSIGCATCHNPNNGNTQASPFTAGLSNQPVHAFSDFELHQMGTGLADNVSQGQADGEDFRTAPLWGVGQRIFLLHDGRTTNLITAIQEHSSSGSEANTVISNFNALSSTQQQRLLCFVRSL